MKEVSSLGLGFVALLGLPACNACGSNTGSAPSASASVTPAAASVSAAPSAVSAGPAIMIPVGLPFTIQPGKGVGPVRFGATVATIERLMAAPCEARADDLCAYPGRAVEFRLKEGVVSEVHVYRRARPTRDGRTYGMFNGTTVEGFTLDMLSTAADELLGKPASVEPVKDPGPQGTVEIRSYKGMRVAFDRLANGKVVAGEVILTKE